MDCVSVIGAGLAGCEAAWALANYNIPVNLYEMKPVKYSPAHRTAGFAELVCSNSFKAARLGSAAGLLKVEMRALGSLLLVQADANAVPAGGALAVDREGFSQGVTAAIRNHPLITVHHRELTEIPPGPVIIATGPLTSEGLANSIQKLCGGEYLSFYDAAAPIVTLDSIDETITFRAARYGRGEDDYINCPFNKEEYERFYSALVTAESAEIHSFDKRNVYEGCMPVEIMAKRGADTMRFGPLRPVGLTDPRTGHRPWAVVQLRQENAAGTLYNLVGFQTNLKFSEQKRVFSLIPGLANADIVRYGVMHRNTFLDSPRLLDATFALRSDSRISFAGQITGVEGYMESAASGILAARNLVRRLRNQPPLILPGNTMMGALAAYISDESMADFQPMGANMGILPPLEERIKDKQSRYLAVARRAMDSLRATLESEETA